MFVKEPPRMLLCSENAKTDIESPQGNYNPTGLHVPLAELKNIQLSPDLAKSPQIST